VFFIVLRFFLRKGSWRWPRRALKKRHLPLARHASSCRSGTEPESHFPVYRREPVARDGQRLEPRSDVVRARSKPGQNPAVFPDMGSDQRLPSPPFGRGPSSSSALVAFVGLATVIARCGVASGLILSQRGQMRRSGQNDLLRTSSAHPRRRLPSSAVVGRHEAGCTRVRGRRR
jgi:hypothetical protein